jgi:hypothetical protein
LSPFSPTGPCGILKLNFAFFVVPSTTTLALAPDKLSTVCIVPIIGVYGLISFIIYFYINYKNNNLEKVFGPKLINKIENILKLK